MAALVPFPMPEVPTDSIQKSPRSSRRILKSSGRKSTGSSGRLPPGWRPMRRRLERLLRAEAPPRANLLVEHLAKLLDLLESDSAFGPAIGRVPRLAGKLQQVVLTVPTRVHQLEMFMDFLLTHDETPKGQ